MTFDNTYDSKTTVKTNTDMETSSTTATETQALLLRDEEGPASISASNGRIYKLSRVLDPYATYFGSDGAPSPSPETTATTTTTTTNDGTMADILLSHPNLTTLASALSDANPDFLTRLSLYTPADSGRNPPIYLAPSDAAFGFLPAHAFASTTQPSNAVLSAYLLGFGLAEEEVASTRATRMRVRDASGDGVVFGAGGWRPEGEEPREPLRVEQGSTFSTSVVGSPAGGDGGGERCADLVFGVGGWKCRGEEGSGEEGRREGLRELRERSAEAEARRGCEFSVGGWHCEKVKREVKETEKREADPAIATDENRGCSWTFGVNGFKKYCPRGIDLDQRSLEKRCDLQFDVGGWQRVCPRSVMEREGKLPGKRQVKIPTSGVLRSVSGFNITLNGGMANNARVEEVICAENGCVWVIGRWLDPVFGIF